MGRGERWARLASSTGGDASAVRSESDSASPPAKPFQPPARPQWQGDPRVSHARCSTCSLPGSCPVCALSRLAPRFRSPYLPCPQGTSTHSCRICSNSSSEIRTSQTPAGGILLSFLILLISLKPLKALVKVYIVLGRLSSNAV